MRQEAHQIDISELTGCVNRAPKIFGEFGVSVQMENRKIANRNNALECWNYQTEATGSSTRQSDSNPLSSRKSAEGITCYGN